MADLEKHIDGFLEPYSEEIRELAQALRAWLKKETRPGYELAGLSAQSFNIGYSFTTTSWDSYCAIIVYRNHINISFPSGAFIADPDGLLHGVGSRVRHIKVQTLKDLQAGPVRTLLKEARKHALSQVKDKSTIPRTVQTVIKRRRAKA